MEESDKMKKTLIFLGLLIGTMLNGQSDSTQTLLKDFKLKVRGQFALHYETSEVNQSALSSLGAGAGLIFNKRVSIEFYAMGSLTTPERIAWDGGVNPNLESLTFFEGGGKLSYIFKPYRAIHVVVSSKFGGVHVEDNSTPATIISDDAFVWTPQVEAELNLTRAIKLSLGIGYRFTNRSNTFYKNNETNSPIFSAALRFGRFAK
ncbi:MAG TPA: hypothetical protein PLZ32_01030 [Saprospiraceae bacterium]|nr:hypothetical protein [Saprospiraceae bacterium]